MIIRASQQEINEYINSPALNQSKLKLLGVSAQAFQEVKEPEMFFEEKEHFVIGKGVDDYITLGQDYFYDVYYISDVVKPSDTIMSIIQQAFSLKESDLIEENTNALLTSINAHNYQSNWKLETKINKVITEGKEYWDDLLLSQGKNVLSAEQALKITSVANQILTHRFTAPYFEEDKDVTIFYQLPIYFEIEGIQCKALLDMLIVDRTNKEIIPIDIKTIGDYTKNFDTQILKRRYDIQAAWYIEALFKWLEFNALKEYDVVPFTFIVASTTKKCDPLIFRTTPELLNVGKYGYSKITHLKVDEGYTSSEKQINGFSQLLEIYKWHNENGWEFDYEAEMAKGMFFISSDFQKFT